MTAHHVSDWFRLAFRSAEYFGGNAYETRGGTGTAGPLLPTSNPPKGWGQGQG